MSHSAPTSRTGSAPARGPPTPGCERPFPPQGPSGVCRHFTANFVSSCSQFLKMKMGRHVSQLSFNTYSLVIPFFMYLTYHLYVSDPQCCIANADTFKHQLQIFQSPLKSHGCPRNVLKKTLDVIFDTSSPSPSTLSPSPGPVILPPRCSCSGHYLHGPPLASPQCGAVAPAGPSGPLTQSHHSDL